MRLHGKEASTSTPPRPQQGRWPLEPPPEGHGVRRDALRGQQDPGSGREGKELDQGEPA